MTDNISSLNNFEKVLLNGNNKTQKQYVKLEYPEDIVELSQKKKTDKSNNGKFDISECAKNFAKGVFSPLTAIVKHPVMTAGVLAATIGACYFIPVLGPILGVGFGALSAFQLGKGVKDVVTNYKKGEYDNAEKSFDKVGQGTIGVAMSAFGLKQSAKVAKEAKLMAELKTNVLTQAQRETIALEVKNGTKLDALKEIGSLFTTKTGLKAVGSQFKPSSIKTRFVELKEFFKGNRVGTRKKEIETRKLKNQAEEFKKTPEGIRRAALTDEEIQAEAQSVFDKAFDELNIPKDKRPKLEVVKGTEHRGGSYSAQKHTIEYSIEGYKSGSFEMEDVIMHEATHCKEALLRAGLPQDRVDEIVRQELISRIKNGESENIMKKGGFLGPEMMEPPKLSDSMKTDFIDFAKENLYTKKTPSDLSSKLEILLDKHPEFIEQYSGREEAIKVLTDYATSHNIRYTSYSNVNITRNPYGWDKQNIIYDISNEEIALAEQSLKDSIATMEGNGRISGLNGLFAGEKGFNQYQFSPEEVLAQKNGNEFLIKTLNSKLASMKDAGTLTPEQETFMTGLLEKAKTVIEYKTKGLEYYERYTQMINNPSNKELASTVESMAKELEVLAGKIKPEEYEIVKQIIEVPDLFNPDIVSASIPKSVTVAADIIAENTKNE